MFVFHTCYNKTWTILFLIVLLLYLLSAIHPRNVPEDMELLALWQWSIIISYWHNFDAPALTSLPVYQLIWGHRIPIGIKWHSITILWKIYCLQLSKNLKWRKESQRKYCSWNNCEPYLYLHRWSFWIDLFGVYPGEFVTQSHRICVLTHCIMNGMSYCVNSLVHHVGNAELRSVGVRTLESRYVLRSITHSLTCHSNWQHRRSVESFCH